MAHRSPLLSWWFLCERGKEALRETERKLISDMSGEEDRHEGSGHRIGKGTVLVAGKWIRGVVSIGQHGIS